MNFIKSYFGKLETLHDFGVPRKFYKAHLKALFARKSEFQIDVFDAIRFIFEENIDLYEALKTLYSKGHMQACFQIARSIIENDVNLQYILQKDTERRAKNYVLQPISYLLKGLKNTEDLIPGKEEMIAELNRIKSEIDKSGNKNSWDGKSFKEICDELGKSLIYDMWYRRLSKYVHSQYRSVRGFDREGPYNDFIKRFITVDVMVLSFEALKAVNEKYNLREGVAIIKDYPHKGAVCFYSISSKAVDEKNSNIAQKTAK